MVILSIFLILFLFLISVNFSSAGTWVCEKCDEVKNTFTLENVYLSQINTIKLVGYQSHGLKSLSIECELICGAPNQPCCYNGTSNRWECKFPYLYCNQQNANGVCITDTKPPIISIVTIPYEAQATGAGCSSYLNQSVDMYIQCNDVECGYQTNCCSEYRLLVFYSTPPQTCPTNENQYYPISSNKLTINQHSYVCAVGKDNAGNFGFMQKPVEICVTTNKPYPPFLYLSTSGADFVVVNWKQIQTNSPNFDRYELHYSTIANFNITPMTLYGIYKEEKGETKVKVEGLKPSTTYYFKVVVFDKTNPPLSSTSNEIQVTTLACNQGEKIQCFKKNGVTYYGDYVNKVIKGICYPGNATCLNGKWGYCENQTGPFIETCNGLDDDCDGYIDNKYYNNPTYKLSQICYGYGICGVGEVYCINGKWQNETTECSSLSRKVNETCNGLDDDCDGIIDNIDGKITVEETRCGCYNGSTRKYETCNGIDDDCNGVIDDVANPSTCACYKGAHKSGELSEICNGIDDDCDGTVDDTWTSILGTGWPIIKTACGQGTPCKGGYWECASNQSGVVCSTIGGSQNQARNEECNGIDDDCDGTIDERCECTPPGGYRECGIDVGECKKGVQKCENGKWGICISGILPTLEICDGKDNDCDGVVDNVGNGASVETTRCGCYNKSYPSYETCNGIDDDCNGVIDDVANPSICACYKGAHKSGELNEICNGIDDDCDEAIDEDWPSLGKPCGEGICAGGKIVCSTSDNSTVCSTMSNHGFNATDKRRAEVCNGLDDDCDGVIDNIDGKNAMEETKCRCTLYGKANQTAEVCNHIDDDCDGTIDEDLFCVCYTGEKKPCGSAIGECELGETECVDGVWGICKGGKGPSQEICNMKDDDCDGMIDDVNDGYSVEETQCSCFNGALPTIESCDGIDNDCNGKIDDDIDCRCTEGQKLPCGSNVGICTPGVKECINGKWSECKGGVLPSREICNGKDDDCNGIVDDVNSGSSLSSTKCACYNNFARPGTQEEIANGIDDDCDGMIDEGFITEEEPSYCYDGIKDGDEDGVDCGGSCKKQCPSRPKPIPYNMWILFFAVVVAIIIIFGIFLSSLWKGEKKGLSERIKYFSSNYKKIIFIFFILFVTFGLFFTNVLFYKAESVKQCFVGYSEYNILTYANIVNESQYRNFLDTLANYKINFVRVWVVGYSNWESYAQQKNSQGVKSDCPNFIELLPFKRSSPNGKYNLTDYDENFFIRMKNFISYAKNKNITIELTFFDSWGLKHLGEWQWNPWDCNFNLNGRICERGSCEVQRRFFDTSDGVMMEIERKLVQKVVSETKQFDNIIYEIMNEPVVDCNDIDVKNKYIQWNSQVIQWVREIHPQARISLNDVGLALPTLSPNYYNFITPHYGFWKDSIPQAVQTLSIYGKHIIIDDDGCAEYRKNVNYQQQFSMISINNGASYNHFQDDLYCNSFFIDNNMLSGLKNAGEQCTVVLPFINTQCSDGTPSGQCSTNRPLYCNNGILVNNCELCGCPAGKTCKNDGSCGEVTLKNTWNCNNGFSCVNTPTLSPSPCVVQPYLPINNTQYTFTFNAQPGNYSCNITLTANHFDFTNSMPEYQEITDVYLNDIKIGTTQDSFCPPGQYEINGGGGGGCSNNVPADVGSIREGCNFLSGMDYNKFCKKGYIKFKITNPPDSRELDDISNENRESLLFALGNTNNRNLVLARLQVDNSGRYVIKIGGGACYECWSCCYCVNIMGDAYCGSEVYRDNSPSYDINKDYKISWNGYSGEVCIQKEGESEVCFNKNIPIEFAFNSYCEAPDCVTLDHKSYKGGERGPSSAIVELTDFVCEDTISQAPPSCYINNQPVGMTLGQGKNCTSVGGGGGGGECNKTKNCGESCTIIDNCDPCKEGSCISVNNVWRCFNCCGDGVCQNNEDYNNCPADCCPEGEINCNGECCPLSNCCNGKCCGTNEHCCICSDPSLSGCAPIGTTCLSYCEEGKI